MWIGTGPFPGTVARVACHTNFFAVAHAKSLTVGRRGPVAVSRGLAFRRLLAAESGDTLPPMPEITSRLSTTLADLLGRGSLSEHGYCDV